MRHGYIALTEVCSHHCIACPCSQKPKLNRSLDLQDVKRTVELALQSGGLDSLILSGGEPTRHPQIFEILEYLARQPIESIGFLTTCERISDKHFLDEMLKIVPRNRLRVTTAIHSFDPLKHDFMTNCVGSLDKSLRGLKNAVEAGVAVSMKYIVSKPTYSYLDNYIRNFYQQFPDTVSLVICNLDYCGIIGDQSDLVKVSFTDSRPYLESLLDYVIEQAESGHKRAVRVYDTPCCGIDPYYWKFLNCQSNYVLAVYNSPHNVNCEPSQNVPNDSGPFFTPCQNCKVKSMCPGAWRSTEQVFGSGIFKPF